MRSASIVNISLSTTAACPAFVVSRLVCFFDTWGFFILIFLEVPVILFFYGLALCSDILAN